MPAWSRRAGPQRSPTRAMSSSRSPICAGTNATTAPSSPCRASCAPRAVACSSSRTRCSTSRAGGRPRLQGGAVHSRRPAGRSVAGGGPVARRTRLRLHPRLSARGLDPGAGGDRAAAAPESRGDELGGDLPAQAGGPVHGHDAGDHRDQVVHRERQLPLRQPGQGSGGAAARHHRRGPPLGALHHGHPGRHR